MYHWYGHAPLTTERTRRVDASDVTVLGSKDERRTLDALSIVLGPQFAGSDEGGRWTELGFGPA